MTNSYGFGPDGQRIYYLADQDVDETIELHVSSSSRARSTPESLESAER